jgi:TolA-binding protein
MAGGSAGRGRPETPRAVAIAVAALLVAGGAAGCGAAALGAKPGGEATAPADPVAVLRQDVDRLRAELSELRALVESVQRGGVEHADRAAAETRAEIEAVQKALEAGARHDLQRQIEVLDAQTRRIDVLDTRAAEQAQALRRVELALTGVESQLTRVLDAPPAASGRGARPGAAPRPAPAASPPQDSASAADGPVAGGADPAPLAAPGTPGKGGSPAAGRETRVDPPAPPPAAGSPSREPAPEGAARPPKPGDASREARATRPPQAAAAPPAGRPPTARELFDRAMASWNRGERGQAVLDFEELVQRFPSDPLGAAAQFRIGEAYYAVRDFERAVLGYRRAVELAPTGKDTPQALLRLGLAYRAQKREADARQAWNQLVRDFPESGATEEARRALRGR